jgi:hypothetical protein
MPPKKKQLQKKHFPQKKKQMKKKERPRQKRPAPKQAAKPSKKQRDSAVIPATRKRKGGRSIGDTPVKRERLLGSEAPPTIHFVTGDPAAAGLNWAADKSGKDAAKNQCKTTAFTSVRLAGSCRISFTIRSANIQQLRHELQAPVVAAPRVRGTVIWTDDGEPPTSGGTIPVGKLLTQVRRGGLVPEEEWVFAWLESVQRYIEPDGSPWKTPLMRVVCHPRATNSTNPEDELLIDCHVYFSRLLFYLIADTPLKTVLAHLTPPRPPTKALIVPAKYPTSFRSTAAPSAQSSPNYMFTPQGLLKAQEHSGYRLVQQPLDIALSMKPYQLQTLAWMIDQEKLGGMGINSLFWEERRWGENEPYYYMKLAGELRLEPPPRVLGGILCEEMGMGKTLEMVALVVADNEEQKAQRQGGQSAADGGGGAGVGLTQSSATLVIAPEPLLQQWLVEIEKSVGAAGKLKIVQYLADTGSDANSGAAVTVPSVAELARADVVITTYKTLMCETRKQKKIPRLLKVYWRRVVLDEMQEIRSSTTELAKTCRGLQSKFRWMVSGTPLFTGVEDLNGELAFLGVQPFCLHDNVDGFWGRRIQEPLHDTSHPEGRLDAHELLNALLGGVMMRHSKSQTTLDGGAILSGLPPATIDTVAVPLETPTPMASTTDGEDAMQAVGHTVSSRASRSFGGSGSSGGSSSQGSSQGSRGEGECQLQRAALSSHIYVVKWMEHVGATALRRLLATLANSRRMRQQRAQQRARQRQALAQHRGRGDDGDDEGDVGGAGGNNDDGAYGLQQTSRAQLESLLRLMRAACVSPVLLNGGDGCTSEVAELNEMARREGIQNPVLRQMQQVVRSANGMQHSAGGGDGLMTLNADGDDCTAGLCQMSAEDALQTLVNENRSTANGGDMVAQQPARRNNYDTGRKTTVDSVGARLGAMLEKEEGLQVNVNKVHKKTWFMAEIVGYSEEAAAAGSDSSGSRMLDIKCIDKSPHAAYESGKIVRNVHPSILSYFDLEAPKGKRETPLQWALQAAADATTAGIASGVDAVSGDDNEDEAMGEASAVDAGPSTADGHTPPNTAADDEEEARVHVLVDEETKEALDLSGSGPPVRILCRPGNVGGGGKQGLSKLRWEWAVEMITGGRYLDFKTMSARHLRRTFQYALHLQRVHLAKRQWVRAKERAAQLKDADGSGDTDDEEDVEEDGEEEQETGFGGITLERRALFQSAFNRPHQLVVVQEERQRLFVKAQQVKEQVLLLQAESESFVRSAKMKQAREEVSMARIDYNGVANSKPMLEARQAVVVAKKALVAAGGKVNEGRGRLWKDGGKDKVLGQMKKVKKLLEKKVKEQRKRQRERQRKQAKKGKGRGGGAAAVEEEIEKLGENEDEDDDEEVADGGGSHATEEAEAEANAVIERIKGQKAALEPKLQEERETARALGRTLTLREQDVSNIINPSTQNMRDKDAALARLQREAEAKRGKVRTAERRVKALEKRQEKLDAQLAELETGREGGAEGIRDLAKELLKRGAGGEGGADAMKLAKIVAAAARSQLGREGGGAVQEEHSSEGLFGVEGPQLEETEEDSSKMAGADEDEEEGEDGDGGEGGGEKDEETELEDAETEPEDEEDEEEGENDEARSGQRGRGRAASKAKAGARGKGKTNAKAGQSKVASGQWTSKEDAALLSAGATCLTKRERAWKHDAGERKWKQVASEVKKSAKVRDPANALRDHVQCKKRWQQLRKKRKAESMGIDTSLATWAQQLGLIERMQVKELMYFPRQRYTQRKEQMQEAMKQACGWGQLRLKAERQQQQQQQQQQQVGGGTRVATVKNLKNDIEDIKRDAADSEAKLHNLGGYVKLLQRVCAMQESGGGIDSGLSAQVLEQTGFQVLQGE